MTTFSDLLKEQEKEEALVSPATKAFVIKLRDLEGQVIRFRGENGEIRIHPAHEDNREAWSRVLVKRGWVHFGWEPVSNWDGFAVVFRKAGEDLDEIDRKLISKWSS